MVYVNVYGNNTDKRAKALMISIQPITIAVAMPTCIQSGVL